MDNRNLGKGKGWVPFLFLPAILATSVLAVIISGNDKGPFLVLMTIGMIGIIFVVTGISLLSQDIKTQRVKFLCLGSAAVLIYVTTVIVLSRAGLVDSMLLLGFR